MTLYKVGDRMIVSRQGSSKYGRRCMIIPWEADRDYVNDNGYAWYRVQFEDGSTHVMNHRSLSKDTPINNQEALAWLSSWEWSI